MSTPETNTDVVYDASSLAPSKRLLLGVQHLFAMFGATVLVPALTGLDVANALLFAGLGTLLFHLITGRKIPAFLGSSFAFIGGYNAIRAMGSDGGDALPLILPQILPRDAGRDNILKADEKRDIFKVAAGQHTVFQRFAERGIGQILGQHFQTALLALWRQNVDKLGRTGCIGIDVAGDLHALLPGLLHQA